MCAEALSLPSQMPFREASFTLQNKAQGNPGADTGTTRHPLSKGLTVKGC